MPEASPAARAAEGEPHGHSTDGRTPADAFELARRTFIDCKALDMQALAGRLRISLETLEEWCGDRESLLGEINASLALDLLQRAKAEHSHERGTARVLAVYEQFACSAANFRPLQVLLQDDQQLALRVLTSRTGHVHPAMVNAIHALMNEEHELGALATPKSELRNLSYAIVRMAEAFLYNDAMLATEPQIHRSTRMVGRLMA